MAQANSSFEVLVLEQFNVELKDLRKQIKRINRQMRRRIITRPDGLGQIQALQNSMTRIETERETFLAEVNATKENIRGWNSDLEQQSSN